MQFQSIIDQAWSTGRVTSAQRQAVLTRPDLAAITVDPPARSPTTSPLATWLTSKTQRAQTLTDVQASTAAYATRTTRRDRYVVYENWLHSKLFDYHFVVAWSYDGYQVVGTPSSYAYIANCAGTCQNLGIQSNSQYRNYSGPRVYAWTIPLRREAIYGKAGSTNTPNYPTVQFGVYFDGTYHYDFLSK